MPVLEGRGSSPEDQVSIDVGGTTVSGLWMEPANPHAVVVLAHGANGNLGAPFLHGVAAALCAEDVSVLRFNFPYVEQGRRSPDRAPLLVATWRAALREAGRRAPDLPVVAAGKSMGGRIASMLASDDGPNFAAASLVFFGYPLHPAGKVDQRRESHLFSVKVPMLFVQGTRDALARFDLVEDLVDRLGPIATLQSVTDANHSFSVRGAESAQDETGGNIGRLAAAFVRSTTDAASAMRRARGARADAAP